jgi:hypothetical protein
MTRKGTHDYQFLDFGKTGISIERAAAIRTAAGVSMGAIMRAASNAMAAVPGSVSDIVRALTVQTDDDEAGLATSASFRVDYGSEYAVAMPQTPEELSHQLPVRKLDVATQFTEDWLDNATERQVAVTLDGMTSAFANAYEVLTLDALFNPAAIPLTENSSSVSPKLIGYTANDPAYGRVTLANGAPVKAGYTHYLRETAANVLTAIRAARKLLLARGESLPPFDLFPTQNAADAITALEEFVPARDAYVRDELGKAVATIDETTYLGVIRGLDILVRKPLDRVLDDGSTASWFSVAKTYGDNAAGNPVAWYFHPGYGLTPVLRSRSQYPLEYATAINRAGFGVNRRFGAVNVKLAASGDYTAPSIRA